MDETDAYRLKCLQSYIMRNLDANHVTSYLIEREVLSPDQDDEIRAEGTAKLRTEKLLKILPTTCPNALEHLRHALSKDHAFIVDKMDNIEVPVQPTQDGGMHSSHNGNTNSTGRHQGTTYTNISGNNNLVILGGVKTTVNNLKY